MSSRGLPLWGLGLSLIGCGGQGHVRGVVVVSLDTLRADRLGAWGSTAGLTPNLDRMAAESVVFDQAYSQANETLYSHAALFTGRYPGRLAPLDGDFHLTPGTPTLAARFQAAGWDTAAFVAGGHLSKSFGLNPGFDAYGDEIAWASVKDTGASALHWLDTRPHADKPFFLFVHGYDAHDRYLKPTPFGYAEADLGHAGVALDVGRRPGGTSEVLDGHASRRTDVAEMLSLIRPRFARGEGIAALDLDAAALDAADTAHLAGLYDGAVAWADANVGTFFAGLDRRGLLDDVVLVVLSDHGEELGEAGVFHHRYSISDAVAHVPLMVHLPGGAHGGRRTEALVGLVDVGPTVLDLAGVEGFTGVDGRSLRPLVEGTADTARSVVVTQGALRLLSARTASARLTVEGISPENSFAAALYAALPVDGVTTQLQGDADQLPALRDALVAFARGGAP